MTLTSGPFLAVVSIVAAATMAATILLWPCVAGRKASHAAARTGLLIATQLTAILAVLGGLNAYFSFIVSWSDLVGTHASTTLQAAHGAAHAVAAPIVVTQTQIPAAPRTPRPAASTGAHGTRSPAPARTPNGGGAAANGEILTVQITGDRTGITVPRSYVYLPPQYFQPAYAHRLFPVVLVLTGYPSDPRSEITRLNLPGAVASEIAAGRVQPTIFVMMFSSVDMPRDTECTDIPSGPQAETFFAEDVPLAVEQSFRAATGAAGWAVMGDSTGGYCAAKLAMMHSDRFAAAVSLSGYYTAVQDFTTGSLYGRSAAYRSENDLFWRLGHLPPPPVSVLLTSSRVGEDNYLPTLRFLSMIRPPMHGYSLILPVGGHNFRTWKREIGQALQWMSQRLVPGGTAGPSPSPHQH
ncbi:MAG TPA: alpha/beta hydrolase-fold protein [Streptosporangiaceae bacterium]|nr:alpha/beta hydrolase-fold protein [Streptosporangiaceae bacterium]